MITIDVMREFFGWSTVISMGLLVFTMILLFIIKEMAWRMHSKMFDIEESDIRLAYYRYLGHFKIAIIIFNMVPYIVLRIMS
jgi:hypothetical protein